MLEYSISARPRSSVRSIAAAVRHTAVLKLRFGITAVEALAGVRLRHGSVMVHYPLR